jgi:hypothetical protein
LPRTFTLRNAPRRLAESGDAWAALHARPLSLAHAGATLSTLLTDEDRRLAHAASVRKPKARKAPRR